MNDEQPRHGRISLATIALWGVSVTGSALMFAIHSPQTENAIQIATCGALAGIVASGFRKTNTIAYAVIDAALQLSAEMAQYRSDLSGPEGADEPGGLDADGMGQVIQLPRPRGERAEKPEAG